MDSTTCSERLVDDGRKTWKRLMVEFGEAVHFRPVGENNGMRGGDKRMLGHHGRSGAAIFLTPDGVKCGTRIARILEHERWDRVFRATCNRSSTATEVRTSGTWRDLQGVAPVIVMAAVSRVDRRRNVTKQVLVN